MFIRIMCVKLLLFFVYNSQNILKTVNGSTAKVYAYSTIHYILLNNPIFGIRFDVGN